MSDSPRQGRRVERLVRLVVTGLMTVMLSLAAALPELPADLRRLAGLAASLPPEFQADALLQIVESRGGLDPALKKNLLEQASTIARQARNPYPKVIARGTNADSRQAFAGSALGLKLDRLSLETRAIRVMLAFDPTSARVMFQQQLQKPAIPNGTCSDALIPQLDDYYDVAAQVAARGFTPKELNRQEHVAMLLQILAGLRAPYEVGDAARMVSSVNLPSQQFEAVLNAFTARLETIAPDDRSFTETGLATQQEISALASRVTSAGISRTALARAYRKYLTANYSKARCADSPGARIAGNPTISPVDWFNQSDLRGDLPAIEMKEISVKDPGGKIQVDGYWSTPDSEKILEAARSLRNSPGGVLYSSQDRLSSEWNQKLQEFLEQVSQWKQSGDESELDFFNQKALVYESLIDVCPTGEARQRMIYAFVDFLKSSNALAQTPVDWFWHVQNMYRRLRQAGDDDATKLMTAYKGSGNLMLEVYAQLNGR